MASSWRLLYHYMRDHSLIPSAEDGSSRWQCPSFDPKRCVAVKNAKNLFPWHNLLCSELKQLYVVLTRARQRLWIYEEDEGARRPAMDLWGAMGVVAVKALTADLLTSMHTESSPEGWHKRGTELFNAAQFEAAVLSFERAGDEHSAAVERAALLQQTAKRLQGTDPKKASKTFQDAADAFLKVDKPRDAARCLISAGKMKQAGEERWSEVDEIGGRDVKEEGRGDVYRDRCVPPMWVKSGECYELAAMAEEAAQCFAQVWEVERALLVCAQNRLYTLGVSLLHVWQGQVEEGMRAVKVKQNQQGQQLQQQKQEEEEEEKWKQRERLVIRKNAEFLQQAAMFYYRKKNMSEVMMFVHQLPSLAKKRPFLERRDFFGELLQIEITEGNFQRAAEMMLKKGDMVGAARMFLGQKEWGRAFECAMGAARVVSMWANGNKGWPLNVRERKQEKVEKQEVTAETRKDELLLGLGKEDEGKRVKVKAGNGEAVPNAWEARADADESETEVQGKIDAPEGGGKQQKAETQEKAEKQEGVETNVGENIDATMDALETAVAVWVWERKAREQGKDVKDLEEGSSVGLGIQGLGGVSGREGGEVDEREGLEAVTLLWLRDFHALAGATGRGRQVDSGGEEMDKWWQLLIRCRADELLGMVGAMGKGALGGESAGQAGVVPEEGEEEEEDLGLGERSLAAEVLVSWKGLQLSIQRAKASLSHHASTSLPRSSATPSAPILPSPAKPAANQPSRPSPGAAAAAVTLRPEWQAVNQGAPQQLQQQEQAQKQKQQEELPFEAEWREVKVWWGRWSERVAAMVSALQRLQRRRELPSDAPWLDATFHLLAVSSPASSSSSHSASHVLASSSAQSFLVGLSSAHWLNPVRAAVSHLPNQGTRGEVAREAAARAGAIYWARQASEMVKECAAVMQQAMRSLEKGLLGRRERGAAGDKKRARELHLQLELWVEIHALLQFAIDLCGGGRQEQNLQQGEEQSSQVQGAGGVGEEGGIAQMAGDVEIWKEQQERATLRLLSLLFPKYVVEGQKKQRRLEEEERQREEEQRQKEEQRQQQEEEERQREEEQRLQQEEQQQEGRDEDEEDEEVQQQQQQQELIDPLVPLGSFAQLMQVLPYLGSWWIRRECQDLIALMPPTRMDVCAQMLQGAQWELEGQSLALQEPSFLPGSVALDMWGVALNHVYKWCYWDVNGFVSFPVFLSLAERAAVHTCAAITNLENLVIPTSLASLHLEGQHYSNLCTHMLMWSSNRNPSTLAELHTNVLSPLLDTLIRFLVFEPENLIWWLNRSGVAPAERGSLFLRLLVLVAVSVCNVDCHHGHEFFSYLVDHLLILFSPLDRLPNPLISTLPPKLYYDLKNMFRRDKPAPGPNYFYQMLTRNMRAMQDPLVVLRRQGSWSIPAYEWKASLPYLDVEFTPEVAAHAAAAGRVNGGQQCFSVFSLQNLTGYRVPLLGGDTENAADAAAAAAVDEEEDGGAGDGTVGEEGAGAESGAGADSDSTTEAAVAPQSGESLEQGDEWGGDEEGKAGTVGGAGKHVGKELKNAQLQTDEREEVDGVKIALRITQQLRSCLHQKPLVLSFATVLLQARERLQEELSPLQQCSREARRALTLKLQSVSASQRAFYLKEYEEHACPLKVDVDAFLALIHEGVRQLKQLLQQGGSGTGQGQQQRKGQGRGWSEEEAEKHEQLLEEALDAEESLTAATSAVHHSPSPSSDRHAGHASASVSWLHSTAIGPLSDLLSQHKALEHRLKQLLHSTEKEGASAQGGSRKGSGRVKQEGSSGVQEPGGGKGKGKKGAGRSGGKDGGKGGKKQRGGRSRR
ncbi:unnamed protein product [Closterium sp. Naga37s-1]|nr:unnamed protein product [Closterium sp. Naga37s-1]